MKKLIVLKHDDNAQGSMVGWERLPISSSGNPSNSEGEVRDTADL